MSEDYSFVRHLTSYIEQGFYELNDVFILEGNNSVFNRIEELFFDIIQVDPSVEIALDYEIFSPTFPAHKATLVA